MSDINTEEIIFAAYYENRPLEKKELAKLLYAYMLKLGEAPLEDISYAYRYRDLFDCKKCAGMIAQMIVKGIMFADTDTVFGTDRICSDLEARQAVKRLLNPSLRDVKRNDTPKIQAYSYKEAKACFLDSVLIDVRSQKDYEKSHLNNARNVPVGKLLLNPYVCEDKKTRILCYCDLGVNSQMAARILIEAGYENVGYFSLKRTGDDSLEVS